MMGNKYHQWYVSILSQGDDAADYVEEHHILPRSLGGPDEKFNLIRVSARKHFLLHWLLTKFTEGQDFYKMQHAFHMMSVGRTLSSWQYEVAAKAQSLAMKKRYEDPKSREEKGLVTSKYWKENPEARKERDLATSKYWEDSKARERMSEVKLRQCEDPEVIERLRATAIKYYAEHPESKFSRSAKLGVARRKQWARLRGQIPDDRTPLQIRKAERENLRKRLKRAEKRESQNASFG